MIYTILEFGCAVNRFDIILLLGINTYYLLIINDIY